MHLSVGGCSGAGKQSQSPAGGRPELRTRLSKKLWILWNLVLQRQQHKFYSFRHSASWLHHCVVLLMPLSGYILLTCMCCFSLQCAFVALHASIIQRWSWGDRGRATSREQMGQAWPRSPLPSSWGSAHLSLRWSVRTQGERQPMGLKEEERDK